MINSLRHSLPFNLFIDNLKIKFVDEVSDLGILFDRKLTFFPHILNIIKKLKMRKGIIYRNNYYLKSSRIKFIIFNTFFLPIIDYGITIWASAAPSYLRQINNVFERIRHLLSPYNPTTLNGRVLYFDLKYLQFYLNNCFDQLDLMLKVPYHKTRSTGFLDVSFKRLNISLRSFPDRIISKHAQIYENIFSLDNKLYAKFIKKYLNCVDSYIC